MKVGSVDGVCHLAQTLTLSSTHTNYYLLHRSHDFTVSGQCDTTHCGQCNAMQHCATQSGTKSEDMKHPSISSQTLAPCPPQVPPGWTEPRQGCSLALDSRVSTDTANKVCTLETSQQRHNLRLHRRAVQF